MLHFTSREHILQKLSIFATSIVKIMRFFRQTLLSVCLILPWQLFAQPIANNDAATTDEDTNVVFDIVGNDTDATFAIDPATVDLDVSSSSIESTFSTRRRPL